jgi:hypothetical protein
MEYPQGLLRFEIMKQFVFAHKIIPASFSVAKVDQQQQPPIRIHNAFLYPCSLLSLGLSQRRGSICRKQAQHQTPPPPAFEQAAGVHQGKSTSELSICNG